MLFIVGTRPRARELRMLTMVCWKCSQPAAHRLNETKNHITLFFIPIIPLGKKQTLQCLLCGANQELDDAQTRDVLNAPQRHPL